MEVPYTEFVIIDSLSVAVQSTGLRRLNNTPISTPPNPLAQFDTLCQAVARIYGCNLYLTDMVRETSVVYNYDPINKNVFVERNRDRFLVVDEKKSPIKKSTYSKYIPMNSSHDLEELEEPTRDEKSIAADFSDEALGWYYDVFRTDPNSPYRTLPKNVFAANIGAPCPGDQYNMIVQCPRAITHVLGYSINGMVTFPNSTLHTDKLRTPLLHIPNGYGICLLAGVLEVFLLDSTFTPVLAFEFHPQLTAFLDGLERGGKGLAVLSMPTVTNLDELIEEDIASKYKDLKVGDEIVQGECSYSYISPDRGNTIQTSTLRHMMSRWGVAKPVLCLPDSVLCMNLDTMERIMTVIHSYIPPTRSILYTTIEKFVNFLYRAGYSGKFPDYETLTEAFVAYQNIKIINSQLLSSDGTLTIDLSPFSSNQTLEIQNWQEKRSKVSYF